MARSVQQNISAATPFIFTPEFETMMRHIHELLQTPPASPARPPELPAQEAGAWLTFADFKEKYSMSISSFRRRVKEGKIERQEFGPRTFRYRWKEE